MSKDNTDADLTCLTAGPDCHGPVQYRMPLSDTGQSYPRCDHHWSARLDLEDQLNRRYPPTPPADWSPDDAGEHWDENDY